MKCPVCHTKIRHNETRCPNCGLTLKKEAQVQLHEEPIHHAETTQSDKTVNQPTHSKEPVQSHSTIKAFKKYYDSLSFYRQQKLIRSVIFGIGLLIFLFVTIMGSFNSFVDTTLTPEKYGTFSVDEASEMLEDDTIITLGYDYIEELLGVYDHLSFPKDDTNVIYQPEIYILKDNIFGHINISKDKYDNGNQITYHIQVDYDLDEIKNVTIYIRGVYDGTFTPSIDHINKNDLTTFLKTYSIEEGYDLLKDYKEDIYSPDKDIYGNMLETDGYQIWIDETPLSQHNKIQYQYSIVK